VVRGPPGALPHGRAHRPGAPLLLGRPKGGPRLRRRRAVAVERRSGGPLPAGGALRGRDERGARGVFGEAFAAAVEALPVGPWSGPVASALGQHLVRVRSRREGPWRPSRRRARRWRESGGGRAGAPGGGRDEGAAGRVQGGARVRRGVLLFLLLTLLPSMAPGHPLALGLIELTERGDGRVSVSLRVSGTEQQGHSVTLPPPAGCALSAPMIERLGSDASESTGEWRCPRGLRGAAMTARGLEGSEVQLIVRARLADGTLAEARLDDHQRRFVVAPRERTSAVAWSYLRMGAAHIAEGLDHLAFVACLALWISSTPRHPPGRDGLHRGPLGDAGAGGDGGGAHPVEAGGGLRGAERAAAGAGGGARSPGAEGRMVDGRGLRAAARARLRERAAGHRPAGRGDGGGAGVLQRGRGAGAGGLRGALARGGVGGASRGAGWVAGAAAGWPTSRGRGR
jgi:hypothetical protein